jgi:hypothetical protein
MTTNEPTNEPNDNAEKIAALQKRRAEIDACTQDWMREDRLAQIDKEIAALGAPPVDPMNG